MDRSLEQLGDSGIKVRLAISDPRKEQMIRDVLSADKNFSVTDGNGIPAASARHSSDKPVLLIMDDKSIKGTQKASPSLLPKITRDNYTLVALLENDTVRELADHDLSAGGVILDHNPKHIVEAMMLSRFGYSIVPPSLGLARRSAGSATRDISRLSLLECAVLEGVGHSQKRRTIARRLGILESAVDLGVRSICRKLRLSNRAAARLFAIEHRSEIHAHRRAAMRARALSGPKLGTA
jgi:DNA-binding NarL/FixJ family response regulator